MKTTDIIALAGVAVATFALLIQIRNQGKPAQAAGTTEVQNTAKPGDAAYGWRYFTDGTAIDPTGAYYKNGVKIWTPYDGVSAGANYLRLAI